MNHVAEATANYKKFWKDLKTGRFVSMVREAAKGESLSNSFDVFNVMKPVFGECPDIEVLYCIFLNSQNKILGIEKMSSGTITHSGVYPREIIKRMIRLKASALVLTHNHPAGNPEPSAGDIEITRKVFIALASIDAILHDHIVVGDTHFSLADEGYIENIKSKYNQFIHGRQ